MWIIDPHTFEVKKVDIFGLEEREEIVEAKVVQNFFAVKTSRRRYLYATNIFKPNLIEFLNFQEDIQDTDLSNYFWKVFAPRSLLS
jgi:hypothetical protein